MRYQIWNKTDDIYVPTGQRFTAAQWLERYPWVGVPGAKMIITTGLINGGVAMEFGATVAQYKAMGATITDGMTDEEILAAIEDFEDNPPGANEPSNEERIAAALEAQVMMAEPEAPQAVAYTMDGETETAETASKTASAAKESPALSRRRNVEKGLWGRSMVLLAVQKGRITEDEANTILGG